MLELLLSQTRSLDRFVLFAIIGYHSSVELLIYYFAVLGRGKDGVEGY